MNEQIKEIVGIILNWKSKGELDLKLWEKFNKKFQNADDEDLSALDSDGEDEKLDDRNRPRFTTKYG